MSRGVASLLDPAVSMLTACIRFIPIPEFLNSIRCRRTERLDLNWSGKWSTNASMLIDVWLSIVARMRSSTKFGFTFVFAVRRHGRSSVRRPSRALTMPNRTRVTAPASRRTTTAAAPPPTTTSAGHRTTNQHLCTTRLSSTGFINHSESLVNHSDKKSVDWRRETRLRS